MKKEIETTIIPDDLVFKFDTEDDVFKRVLSNYLEKNKDNSLKSLLKYITEQIYKNKSNNIINVGILNVEDINFCNGNCGITVNTINPNFKFYFRD